MERWSIYIDIEGFSKIYKKNNIEALETLCQLMKNLYQIGKRIFPYSPKRLFIHQMGDGFVIISDHHEKSLERPLSIAIALMQLTLIKGGVARASISDGNFSDILSCYPSEIIEDIKEKGHLQIGEGVMTISQVMGDALINSYKLTNNNRKGPCLFVDAKLKRYLPRKELLILWGNQFMLEIDWIHSKPSLLNKILEGIDVKVPSIKNLEEAMDNYIKKHPALPKKWARNASYLCSL